MSSGHKTSLCITNEKWQNWLDFIDVDFSDDFVDHWTERNKPELANNHRHVDLGN